MCTAVLDYGHVVRAAQLRKRFPTGRDSTARSAPTQRRIRGNGSCRGKHHGVSSQERDRQFSLIHIPCKELNVQFVMPHTNDGDMTDAPLDAGEEADALDNEGEIRPRFCSLDPPISRRTEVTTYVEFFETCSRGQVGTKLTLAAVMK